MKQHWIEFRAKRPSSPMTVWVHRWLDRERTLAEPPFERVVPGKGYPLFKVELDGFTFEFASLAEMSLCIETLGKKHLPSTLNLSRQAGMSLGPNSHWLSRLPAEVKPWSYREKAVAYLGTALVDFEEHLRVERARA